ncbi:organic solute transporter alpha-like protein [Adelges cooleyi]|uniref:organic solute transporter alpha-like protein n=1 Tax=Adelges cooleyi TaxID=133065 RepID=UPI002180005B|nr:organic solute transporter alpha-like protein [Adelges cooleyi]
MSIANPPVVYNVSESEDYSTADLTTGIQQQVDADFTGSPPGRLLSLEFFSTDHPALATLTNSMATASTTTVTTAVANRSGAAATEATDYAVKNLLVPLCHPSTGIPSVDEYFTAINLAGVTIFTLGAICVIIILYLYVDTLRYIIKNASPMVKTHSAFILSVYPVVAVATYCAILVPRAHLLAEAMTQGMFMACVYQLFCLFMAYCGGEANLVASVKPQSLDMQVPPCCCWPCCCCLPKFTVTKKHLRYLRILVLQLPIVQGFVYMVLLVMWAEEESLYQVNYMYMQPFIVLSIFCGMWGISMTMRVLGDILKDHNIQGKFVVLQLVLVLAKLQGLAVRTMVWAGWLPCKPPISPTVYANLIYNSTMLWEMMVLMALARKLHKKPLQMDPCFVEPPKITCCVDLPSNQEKNNIINGGIYNQCFDMNV